MPIPNANMHPGQSVSLHAWPTIDGMPGGELPGPINWSHNSTTIMATFTPAQGEATILNIPAESPTGSFTVTATSGMLTASCTVVVTQRQANGLSIEVGVPNP